MAPQSLDLLTLFDVLQEHQIAYIVVGGVCAVLHGAPVTTFDLDIVHQRTPENLQRLLQALEAMDAHYRYQTKVLRPAISHLESAGHQLLRTRYGDLDVLGSIDQEADYDALFAHTSVITVKDQEIRLLDLPTLIAIKQRAGRAKDLAALPALYHTLTLKDGGS